jgi:hypothetical protein
VACDAGPVAVQAGFWRPVKRAGRGRHEGCPRTGQAPGALGDSPVESLLDVHLALVVVRLAGTCAGPVADCTVTECSR